MNIREQLKWNPLVSLYALIWIALGAWWCDFFFLSWLPLAAVACWFALAVYRWVCRRWLKMESLPGWSADGLGWIPRILKTVLRALVGVMSILVVMVIAGTVFDELRRCSVDAQTAFLWVPNVSAIVVGLVACVLRWFGVCTRSASVGVVLVSLVIIVRLTVPVSSILSDPLTVWDKGWFIFSAVRVPLPWMVGTLAAEVLLHLRQRRGGQRQSI